MPPRTQAFVAPSGALKPRESSTVSRARRLQGMPVARRILGIDPGLHRTGYGLVQLGEGRGSPVTMLEGGVFRARADDTLPKRLKSLADGLREVLREHRPDAVVVEELFSTYAHPRSALLLAQARGALLLACEESGASVHSFTPNEVKQVIAGNGHASKSEIQSAVKARLRLASPPNPPDVADALALALCFALRQDAAQHLI